MIDDPAKSLQPREGESNREQRAIRRVRSLGRMDSSKLSKTQARQLREALYPHCNYLFRLRRRMEQIGFTHSDPLYGAVCKAYNAMHELNEIHYLRCNGGVGRSSGK